MVSLRTNRTAQRPASEIPRWIILLLALALAGHLALRTLQAPPQARAEALPEPARTSLALRAVSLGDSRPLAHALMLWLQAFDSQPGIGVPFSRLDYAHLQTWLGHIIDLDPLSSYPLLMASRLYADIPDEARQRAMLEFVHQKFLDDPERRWRWLAHSVILAKHRLKDLELARRYAHSLRLHARHPDIPSWVGQMEIFILEDLNELDSARLLLGGLLHSGSIKEEHEARFLLERLETIEAQLKQGAGKSGASKRAGAIGAP